jgi:hypothetical protein
MECDEADPGSPVATTGNDVRDNEDRNFARRFLGADQCRK